MMSEKDVIRVLQYRRTMVGTDGGGVMPGQITHPRIVGSFPQILGRYVRDPVSYTHLYNKKDKEVFAFK